MIRAGALFLSVALAFSGPASAQDAAASRIDLAALAGRWRIAGVAVGDGIGALVRNDPAYMGRELEIGPDRLAWFGGAGGDRCESPALARQTGPAARTLVTAWTAQLKALRVTKPDPHAVECDTGEWGPQASGGATFFPAPDGRLAMSWYDGGLLLLQRRD